MDLHGWLTLGILVVSSILLAKRWLPVEVTALSIPIALLTCGIVSPEQAFSGFGHDIVIALGAVFVIGAGLQESGVTTLVARLLQRFAGSGEAVLVLALMVVAAAVSSVMSNQAVVAVFIPTAMTLARRTLVAPSRLLIPLAFAAVLGGNVTMLGNQGNLVVAGLGRPYLEQDMSVLRFAVVGLPIAVVGILAMVLFGRKLLPTRTESQRLRESLLPEEAARSYGLTKSLFHMRVLPQSTVVGRTIAESGIRSTYGLDILTVVRPGRVRRHFLDARPDLVLAPGDELYVEGSDEAAWRLADYETVQFGLAGTREIEDLLARGMTLAEVTFPPRSEAFGRTLKQANFRKLHGLNVLSLWRKGGTIRDDVADVPLEFGDALLVSGPAESVRLLAQDPDFIVLTDHSLDEDVSRAPAALLLLLLAVVPPLLGWSSVAVSSLAAALLMVATGCLDARRIAKVIDWKVLFIIMGLVPMGIALQETSVAERAAGLMLALTGHAGAVASLAAIFGVAAAVALLTTNGTAATLCAPIAGQVAMACGLEPEKALLAVAYGASCAFIVPSQPWNMLVMGPGGYEAKDYYKVGALMTALVAIVAVCGLALAP